MAAPASTAAAPATGTTVIVVTWMTLGNPDCAVFSDVIAANRFAFRLGRTRDIIPSILTRTVPHGG